MLNVHQLSPQDFVGLSPCAAAELAAKVLHYIGQQSQHIAQQGQQIESQAQAIQFKDAKINSIMFELRRLKAWRFDAKTERMNAEQRQLFEETLAADQADLEAQLAALKAVSKESGDTTDSSTRRQPKRQALPEHLKRVDHHHEPQSTTCGCGQAMVRIGEDVSERLDIIPAQFFVHRHIRGKWTCKCCQTLVQEPVEPQVIDKGMPTAGLVAHTTVTRFVDHIPYYRQEQINARSGIHTPRSTLASWSGQAGAALIPLYDAHRKFVLSCSVVHADETPVAMLDPGAGKTKRAYIWAYARSGFDVSPGVVYEFCVGRGAKYPLEFLKGWSGTLVCDGYGGYDKVMDEERRIGAGCLAHARRKFDELIKDNLSPVGTQAIQRIAALYKIEREIKGLSVQDRHAARQSVCVRPTHLEGLLILGDSVRDEHHAHHCERGSHHSCPQATVLQPRTQATSRRRLRPTRRVHCWGGIAARHQRQHRAPLVARTKPGHTDQPATDLCASHLECGH